MHFDEILLQLGELGRYQLIQIALLKYVIVVAGMSAMSMVFTLGVNDYRCAIPGLSNDTYFSQGDAHDDLVNATIPKGSKCTVYDVGVNGTGEEKECSRWVYDDTIYRPSAVMDFNLVCEKTVLRSIANSAYMVGMVLGAISGGKISDRYGRKIAFTCSSLTQVVAGIVLSVAPDIYTFMVFRCFLGTAHAAFYGCEFTLSMEITGARKRVYSAFAGNLSFALGALLVAPLAYFFRNWRHLTIATVVPSVFFLAYWWLISESPRWLLVKGRKKVAEKILLKMARRNKRPLTEKMVKSVECSEEDARSESLWKMIREKILVARLAIMCFSWASAAAGFYGLILYSGKMVGDVYINYTTGILMDIPAGFYVTFAPLKFGRKAPHVFSLLLGGAGCISCLFVILYVDTALISWLPTVLATIGKLGISAAFNSAYLITAELFPTSIRNICNGICSMFARVVSLAAPFLADLGALIPGPFSKVLPLAVFGAMVTVAGLLSLFLPETHGRPLPETIEEAARGTSRKERAPTAYEMVTNPMKTDERETLNGVLEEEKAAWMEGERSPPDGEPSGPFPHG